ncbi:MAG: hypothetical protein ACREQ5_12375, partial [Candidatus Dormibacteria bacterium]
MSNNEQLVESAKAAESQLQEVREAAGKGYVWLPNATKVRPKPFVEMRTRMNRNQYAMFTDEEQTRKLLKSPEAGMHYHWARHPQY